MQKIEAGLAAKSKPVSAASAPVARTPAKAAVKEKGGSLLIKNIAVAVIAKMTDTPQAEVMAQMYGDDERVKAVSKSYGTTMTRLVKDATSAATTTDPDWASDLVRSDIRGFMEELCQVSVYGALYTNAASMSLEFGGANSVTIPRRDRTDQSNGNATGLAAAAQLGQQMGGAFVGENGVIPVKQAKLTSAVMNRYKMAVISAFTTELLEQSTPNIEAIIRTSILEDTALALDGAFLDGRAAVGGVRPASAFNSAATQAGTSGGTATAVITDLKYLLGRMSSINGASPVLIMNSNRLLGLSTITTAAGGFMFRDEIAAGRLLGIPVIASTTVADTVVGIIDAGSMALANDAPRFAVSDQATLTMASSDDQTPTQAMDAAGAVGPEEQVLPGSGINVAQQPALPAAAAGYEAQSLFQTYSQAVRMVMPTSCEFDPHRCGSVYHSS